MKFMLGLFTGIALLTLTAAYQLSPVDQQQNERLATIEHYLWDNPDPKDNLPITPTAEGTATPTMRPSATITPTATITAVPVGTPSPTELPPMVRGGNISGSIRWVRLCASIECEIVARVVPGGFVVVNPAVIVEAENYRWVMLWNESGYIAYQEISTGYRYIRW